MTVLRSALFNAAFFGFTALAGLACLPLLPVLDRGGVLHMVSWWAGRVLALLRLLAGIRVRVLGEQHLPRAGAAIIAAKHQSAFDTIVWLDVLPAAAYVLKRELLAIPIYGWWAAAAGMIPVDRSAGASALLSLLRGAERAAAEGRQIVIFPEGTRVAPGERRRYQPGVVALYERLALPVIPVATDSGRFWGRRAFRKRAGTITLSVLPAIPPGLPRAEFLSRLEGAIEAETARLLDSGGADGDSPP
ncbi:MAG: 1-acyl-sn-glycerol-3-phosphate acyltransferase [Elioraea sp.]|nr:1-acyl-sn-glycerol-3-phosphate acyltransferase [Elioraea sp.]